MKSNNWITLHRKILDWEWYDDANTFRLFIHLLLKANYRKGKWKGIPVLRGQHITSVSKLSVILGISRQAIRSSFIKLESSNEITITATNHYTCITVCKYDDYQKKENTSNQPDNNPTQRNRTTDLVTDRTTIEQGEQLNQETIDNQHTENNKIPPSPIAEIWGYYIGEKDMMQGMTPTIKRYIAEGMEINPDPLWWKVYCDRRLADDPKFQAGPHKFFTAGGYRRYIEKNSGGIFEE